MAAKDKRMTFQEFLQDVSWIAVMLGACCIVGVAVANALEQHLVKENTKDQALHNTFTRHTEKKT